MLNEDNASDQPGRGKELALLQRLGELVVNMSAVAAALAVGATGREGKVTGALFALLALAACARFAILAAKLPQDPQLALLRKWAPAVAWAVGGIGLLLLLFPKRIRSTA